MQRFVSEDPIGFSSGDFNWYRYVGDSPVSFLDSWGLSGFDNRWGGHGHNRGGYKEDCWTQCMKDRAIWWGSALGLTGAPLSNLKRPQDYHSFGGGKGNKSPFTSIDKKWPNLPGANPEGGFKIPKGYW